jgi:hypothetical protein
MTTRGFTDSRGRNILLKLTHFTPHDLNIEWDAHTLPGANLKTISKWIDRSKRRSTWDITIIIAGICNFTHKVQSRNKHYLEYTISKSEETKRAIDLLLDHHGESTHLCIITPAVLSKFSNHRDGDTNIEEEQKQLLSDIEEVNNYIQSKNIERDTATIDLAIQSYTKSLKKQGEHKKKIIKFTGKDLPDGIHPSITLEDTWAKYIAKVISGIIRKNRTVDDSTEESDQDSGNFKRARRI